MAQSAPVHPDLTLRDYIAVEAMIKMIDVILTDANPVTDNLYELISNSAYKIADKMIERSKV